MRALTFCAFALALIALALYLLQDGLPVHQIVLLGLVWLLCLRMYSAARLP